MTEKTASVRCESPGKKGKGPISAEPDALKRYTYGFASRFEGDRRGANPQKTLASVAEISLQARLEAAAA